MTTVTPRPATPRPPVDLPRLRRRVRAAAAATTVLAAGYLVTHDPHTPGHYPSCVLRQLTGWSCPGCGGTRAAFDLLHGRVAQAWSHNPLVVASLAAVALVMLYRWAVRRRGREPGPMPAWVPIALGVLAVAFGIVRNLPGMGFLGPA